MNFNLKILNKKESKKILQALKEQFDADYKEDLAFLEHDNGRIYIISKEFAELPLERLRINNLGLYFGQFLKDALRLSIEASQIIGKIANKNILSLDDQEIKKWIRGEDVQKDTNLEGVVLIENNNDFYGTGKIKQGLILNFVPKGRRIK